MTMIPKITHAEGQETPMNNLGKKRCLLVLVLQNPWIGLVRISTEGLTLEQQDTMVRTRN